MSTFEIIEQPKKQSGDDNDFVAEQDCEECNNNDTTAMRSVEPELTTDNNSNLFLQSLSITMPSLSDWTQPFNTLFMEAKHHIYTLLGSNSHPMFAYTNPHVFSTDEPVWILGCQYDLKQKTDDEAENENENNKNNNNNNNNNNVNIAMDRVWNKWNRILWITYRRGFEVIQDSKYTSDAGWGCMIRTTQMMCAQGLMSYFEKEKGIEIEKEKEEKEIEKEEEKENKNTNENENENEKENEKESESNESNDDNNLSLYKKVISYFDDTYNASFSLHNMLKYSECFHKSVGTWFGPTEACIMTVKCLEHSELADQIAGLVASHSNGVIYRSEIMKLCCDEKNVWKKSIFIFIPLRLGLDELNSHYISGILRCLQLKHSIGIVGGKPQRSLYFVGYQNEHLFYLDPHIVFDIAKDKSNIPYHCKDIQSLPVREMDPSIAVGFFIHDQSDFELFWKECVDLTQKSFPIFSIGEEMPAFEDVWEDISMNEHDNESSNDSEWEKL